MPYNASQHEQDILKYWEANDTFKKSIEQRPADKPFVFYDGPPFATGLPHYGHIMTGTKKDVIPRYMTMKGYRVERQWGWDCHGLPIENLIEKELQLPGKKEIEEYGVGKFNEACRSKVLEYEEEWKKIIPRMGRWIDMDKPYMTMSLDFMESVWWVFAELYKKGLIYEGKKPMHICPHCVTPLSNFEVTQGYKDIKDLSVIAKFLVTSSAGPAHSLFDGECPVYLLAWTTTPWTLPGNILLAVAADVFYSVVAFENAQYIIAKDLLMSVFEGKEFEVLHQIQGKDLVGLTYEPLFPYYANIEGADNGFRVVTADFVTTEDGTGLVHLAPAFGTDDYEVFTKEQVPFIQHVNLDGTFKPEVKDFAGMNVKPEGDHMATDVEIIKWLAKEGKLFSKKKYEHSYPHCWRCDTPLLNYATSSWFVEVTKLKSDLITNNQHISWIPEHIKDGRFGQWLEHVRDWSISRNRFWGTPLPIWKSEDGDVLCVGSATELSRLTGTVVTDLHMHMIDHLTIEQNGKVYTRVADVLDTWFDSGAVPYGQKHYPFENKEKFEAEFPADFIAESQDQTRGWFYTLHVLATALTSGNSPSIPLPASASAFKACSVNGIVLADDGHKMSKRLKNYPDPMYIVDAYGADAMRYYLVNSPVMVGESLNFSEEGVREVYNKVVNTLWNVVEFYSMFSTDSTEVQKDFTDSPHVLDKWILARLVQLVQESTNGLDTYKLNDAARPIMDFVLDLSQWYVRLSRSRLKGDDEQDKAYALATLQEVLLTLSKVMAPFTPFIAERVFQQVTGNKEQGTSVHLEEWPTVNDTLVDAGVLTQMELVRKVVEMGHSLRKEAGIPVRQPLSELQISECGLLNVYFELIQSELNIKQINNLQSEFKHSDVVKKEDGELRVALVTTIDDGLKKEGLLREVVRAVNNMRKEQGLTREDRVVLSYKTDDVLLASVFTDFADELKVSVLADEVVERDGESLEIDGRVIQLGLK